MALSPHLCAAIVDLDGTMVDTLGDFEQALARAFADIGLPAVSREFIALTVGKGSEHLIRSCLAQVGAAPAQFDVAWQRYQHHYLQLNGQYASVYPGVAEGLDWLRSQGLPLACVTNKPTAFAVPLLEAKGLRRHFSAVFGGDAFRHKKPNPEPLLRCCEALGSAPAQTLMIGDSSNDAQAARAAGCPVVLMRYGFNHGEPVAEAGADAVLDRIDELQTLLLLRAG
jgi:phosphoglycolate phosphatase